MKRKHCPIVEECNKHRKFQGKTVTTRLCPLLIVLGKILEEIPLGKKT